MGKCEQCIVREMSSLKALSKDDLLRLASCKDSYEVKKGDVIFEEGHALNGVYCVKDGVCKLVKMNAQGKDTILKLVTKGELLGQRTVFSNEPSNLSAVAVEDMTICFIPKTELLHFYENNAKFSMEITRDLCGQLREANDFAANHTHKTVKERLALTLLNLQNINGKDNEGYIKLQLSREEIANMVGTATESCIRLMSEFKKEKFIELSGKKIKIINEKKLMELGK